MASNGAILEDVDAWGEDMSATDEDSDTRRLLGEQTTSHNYGSSSSSSEQRLRKGAKDQSSPWRQSLNRLLSLAALWKHRRTLPPNRKIDINSSTPQTRTFCSNRISTTKYNPLTFLPFFLFDQFRRYANLFFLAIGLLQQIPGISPTGRYTTLVPLFMVLLATSVKEIIEDLKRFRADNQVNRRRVQVLRGGKWERVCWTKVKVGDIVRVENQQFFPADLLFLSSSDPLGLCYVETSNLDGETNLKIRQAHPDTLKVAQVETLQGYVECEGPNNRLYKFTGNVSIAAEKPVPIQPDNVLLRGAQLRNTQWVQGLVVYTGPDSKLQQNATRTPLKRSSMDKATNRQVILMFLVLLVLAVVSALGFTIWTSIWAEKMWYLHMTTDSARKMSANFFYSVLTFVILYNNLIPISLIITVEVVKLVQAYLINVDLDMYDEGTDTSALARNSNLNEELGQVKFVFSDKTGTLTENIMEFKQCSIIGSMYSMDSTDGFEESSSLLRDALRGAGKEATLHFFRVLALCHTVIPEWVEDSQTLVYRASSPDEGALVKAAKDLGIIFKARTPKFIIIEVDGREEEYELLNLLEFNSTRKRMSVVVRFPDGSIRLLCKGADTVIYSRLSASVDHASSTNCHLKSFAMSGLRTLCVAERTIKSADYEEWEKVYYAASTHLVKEEKERKLDEAAELIEQKLNLLGATAIEDKLQKDVPETIATLREANMRVWVLTGDKLETAVNIGYASKQLVSGMEIMTISDQATITDVQRKVSEFCSKVSKAEAKDKNAALVIDGKSLSFAISPSLEEDFLSLALACKSVICCRVSPLQKAEVVRLVRTHVKDSVTLAIGDGANDVSMIQAAHIGVGISGREGLQATLASDYAISQFRFLAKLLLVHGAWNYRRLANVIFFSFYKNICLYMIEFWFAFFNGFSGQPLFERWTIGLFNILFASLAPFALGILDQDLSASTRLAQPRLYQSSQQNTVFNTKMFWKWVCLALFHSALLFYAIYFFLWHETPFENGKVFGIWYVGNTVYTSVVVTVNLKAGIETQYWTPLTHFAIWGSIIGWFFYVLVYSHFWPTFPIAVEFVGQDVQLFSSFTFYSLFVLAPVLASLPEFIYIVFKKSLCPTNLDRARVAEVEGRGKKMIDREMSLSVSYSVSSGSSSYGDGMDPSEVERALTYKHGYAFSQEDHGSPIKGTSVQRRDLVRFYDTIKDAH